MNIYVQAMRQRRKAAGLCIACGDKADTATLCRRHADAKRRSAEPLRWVERKNYPVRRKPKGADEQ